MKQLSFNFDIFENGNNCKWCKIKLTNEKWLKNTEMENQNKKYKICFKCWRKEIKRYCKARTKWLIKNKDKQWYEYK